jgi:hypothetical protein
MRNGPDDRAGRDRGPPRVVEPSYPSRPVVLAPGTASKVWWQGQGERIHGWDLRVDAGREPRRVVL